MDSRVDRFTKLLSAAEVDAMLVTHLDNVRYLTGYTGSNGLAVVGPQRRTFITDFRYREQAAEEVAAEFERREAPLDLLSAVEAELPAGELRLGYEEAHLSVRAHRRLREQLPPRVALVGVEGLIEGMRAVKEPAEIDHIRAASQLAADAFGELLELGLRGRTERELALALEVAMRRRGAQRPGFETIVAAGPHGALPHHTPADRVIRDGELVLIDWGAQLDGYCSDCTRTLAVGDPGPGARDLYALVLEAQLAGLAAVRTGAGCRQVDAAARELIAQAGHGDDFGHNLGHGVGLAIHEEPRLSPRSEERLSESNVVTVEPGIYLPGRFGVRIEDLVVVGPAGAQILTEVPKELMSV